MEKTDKNTVFTTVMSKAIKNATRLQYKMEEHFIDEIQIIKKVDKLANKLDDYEATRCSFKKEARQSCNSFEKINRRPELKSFQHSSTNVGWTAL